MVSSLSSTLEQDLNWREAELASLKLAILAADRGSVRESALLRAAWAILYAHYEGFCKFAWDSFLDELQKLKEPVGSFCNEIAVLSFRKFFKGMRTKGDDELWRFLSIEAPRLAGQRAVFEEKLETESNLWPNLYRDNARMLGINPTCIDIYSSQIKALVSRRNDIAHGQKMIIKDLDEYKEYEDATLLVMHDLALCLLDSLERKGYQAV